jgi:hypothetical protein
MASDAKLLVPPNIDIMGGADTNGYHVYLIKVDDAVRDPPKIKKI